MRVALVGTGKMARAHSLGYRLAAAFLEPQDRPELTVVAGRRAGAPDELARRFGWSVTASDWREVVTRDDVDVVDVCTATASHEEVAMAAIQSGKHVVCEKPLAVDASGAHRLLHAADEVGVRHAVVFNYRFVPAVAFARRLLEEGTIGTVRQFGFWFAQEWLADPLAPITWRLRRDEAGSGALGDLGSHLFDLVRYLVGDVNEVAAATHTFQDSRPSQDGVMEAVDVDDAFEALVATASGAAGVVAASRVAWGHKMSNGFELIGTGGSMRWRFPQMNLLEVCVGSEPEDRRGWKRIDVSVPGSHPWADRWWGPGHVLGYEQTFAHLLGTFLGSAPSTGNSVSVPNFADALACQEVLDAVERSAAERCWVSPSSPASTGRAAERATGAPAAVGDDGPSNGWRLEIDADGRIGTTR